MVDNTQDEDPEEYYFIPKENCPHSIGRFNDDNYHIKCYPIPTEPGTVTPEDIMAKTTDAAGIPPLDEKIERRMDREILPQADGGNYALNVGENVITTFEGG